MQEQVLYPPSIRQDIPSLFLSANTKSFPTQVPTSYTANAHLPVPACLFLVPFRRSLRNNSLLSQTTGCKPLAQNRHGTRVASEQPLRWAAGWRAR